jgi:hypothetical protein
MEFGIGEHAARALEAVSNNDVAQSTGADMSIEGFR